MNPLKQGLKPGWYAIPARVNRVFIHESIKTRVETIWVLQRFRKPTQSLSMNPLKQGLKLQIRFLAMDFWLVSLSMNPLKQGLKLQCSLELKHPGVRLYP